MIEHAYRAGVFTWKAEAVPLIELLADPEFEWWLAEEERILTDYRISLDKKIPDILYI